MHVYDYYFDSDLDECTTNSHYCDVNAACQNTVGSYTCTCKAGYTGDGKTCNGKRSRPTTQAFQRDSSKPGIVMNTPKQHILSRYSYGIFKICPCGADDDFDGGNDNDCIN